MLFVERDASDWMSRHFFSGGMMPSDDLALHFQDDLRFVQRWRWDGTPLRAHRRTRGLRTWTRVARRSGRSSSATYGAADAAQWWTRWRMFFMSCAELFGYERGQRMVGQPLPVRAARDERRPTADGLGACARLPAC